MKILDKIKNFFYDEEEIEIPKANEKKEEPKKVSDIPPSEEEVKTTIKKRNMTDIEDIVSERELFKSESTFKFPIIFEEDDFSEVKSNNRSMNVLEVENTKIRREIITDDDKKLFSPSPIISPIYGVLEQNYNNDGTPIQKDDNFLNLYDKDENVDIDSILGKAYGRAEPELRSSQKYILEEELINSSEEESIDLFKDINDDEDIVDIKRESDINSDDDEGFKSDYKLSDDARLKSIDELLESTDEQDFYTLVDSMYENIEE